MSSLLTPARRALFTGATGASPIASSSALTLSGWVRPIHSTKSSLRAIDATSSVAPPSANDDLSAAAASQPTTHYRVTLRRSAIGLPAKTDRVLKAMGLKKRLSSVYLPQNQSAAGNILAVKELVHVDNVRRLDPPVGAVADDDVEAAAAWHSSISDAEAVWVDAKGEVVDWGKEARRAPRGYRVVGNLISDERDRAIRAELQGGGGGGAAAAAAAAVAGVAA